RYRLGRAAQRDVRAALPADGPPAPDRSVPPLRPRARGPQAPRRRQGLQADRLGAVALDEHGPHAPAQHLRQARRRRPRPGRAGRYAARLDLIRRRLAAQIAQTSTTPAASIAQSIGDPWRPCTKVWWNSSPAA